LFFLQEAISPGIPQFRQLYVGLTSGARAPRKARRPKYAASGFAARAFTTFPRTRLDRMAQTAVVAAAMIRHRLTPCAQAIITPETGHGFTPWPFAFLSENQII
jgi:hypothetical protein